MVDKDEETEKHIGRIGLSIPYFPRSVDRKMRLVRSEDPTKAAYWPMLLCSRMFRYDAFKVYSLEERKMEDQCQREFGQKARRRRANRATWTVKREKNQQRGNLNGATEIFSGARPKIGQFPTHREIMGKFLLDEIIPPSNFTWLFVIPKDFLMSLLRNSVSQYADNADADDNDDDDDEYFNVKRNSINDESPGTNKSLYWDGGSLVKLVNFNTAKFLLMRVDREVYGKRRPRTCNCHLLVDLIKSTRYLTDTVLHAVADYSTADAYIQKEESITENGDRTKEDNEYSSLLGLSRHSSRSGALFVESFQEEPREDRIGCGVRSFGPVKARPVAARP
ncbi:hypothetical protein HZH68_001611 [Vespula germanica]|uniref:Uncharacterized protein n=1 Tax=Vespula germanica TaxID=30212 RepID=A0A834NVV9_VESGE|nr:hypothetical protein HZH68_001611 [Vespula germanica]